MRRDFRERLTQQTRQADDQPMYQYFGQDHSTQQTSQVNITQEVTETIVKALDDSRLEKAGYWVMVGVLSVLLIPFVIKMNLSATVGSIMLIALTIFAVRKITFSYDSDTNFYLANATITLKAMLRHFSITAKLLPHSDMILKISVIAMMVEHFLLRWFLFAPLSSLIYTISFYGMWMGVVLCFAKRETAKAYRGLVLAYIYHVIAILLSGFFNNDLYIFTVISALLIWTMAGWMKKCVIEDIKVSK